MLITGSRRNEPPDDGRVSLVHGDYRLDNMIFRRTRRACSPSSTGSFPPSATRSRTSPTSACSGACPTTIPCAASPASTARALGIPTEEEYVAKYCERVGISGIPIWNFCLAFTFFRLAAIVQGVKKRGLDGNASNPEKAIKSGERVPQMAKMGVGAIAN